MIDMAGTEYCHPRSFNMPRPKKWSGETTAIRIPAHLAEKLIEIAQTLDTPQTGFVQNSEMYLITVDDKRYLLPPVAITPQEHTILDALVDRLLQDCKKSKLDPLAIVAEMAPSVCKEWK
jgi:hypothetical protein